MSHTLTLSAPLVTGNGTLYSLTFRRPKARDFIAHGAPFTTERKPNQIPRFERVYHEESIRLFVGALTGLDQRDVRKLSEGDYAQARALVLQIVEDIATTSPKSDAERNADISSLVANLAANMSIDFAVPATA